MEISLRQSISNVMGSNVRPFRRIFVPPHEQPKKYSLNTLPKTYRFDFPRAEVLGLAFVDAERWF
jgi:hypothetical protein